ARTPGPSSRREKGSGATRRVPGAIARWARGARAGTKARGNSLVAPRGARRIRTGPEGSMAKRVAIIGSGNVGSALKRGLSRAGHDARTSTKADSKQTAEWGELVILAVPFG